MAVVLENAEAGSLTSGVEALTGKLDGRRRAAKETAQRKYTELVTVAAAGELDDSDLGQVEETLKAADKSPEQFANDVERHAEGIHLADIVATEPALRKQLEALESRKKTALEKYELARRKRDEDCRRLETELATLRAEIASTDRAKQRLRTEFPKTATGERLRMEACRADFENEVKNLTASKVGLEAALAEDRGHVAALERTSKKRRKLIRGPAALALEDRIDDPSAKVKDEAEKRIHANTKRLEAVRSQLADVGKLLKGLEISQ